MKLTIKLRLYDDNWNTIKMEHRCVDFGTKEKIVPVFQSMLKIIRKAARDRGEKLIEKAFALKYGEEHEDKNKSGD